MSAVPDRVKADLVIHGRERERLRDPFDEWNDALMHDICGARLSKPVQALLIALSQIEKTNGSFGADAAKTVQFLLPKLQALHAACIEEWKAL